MKLRHLVAALLAVGILSGVRGIKPPDHWSQPRLFRGTILEATYIPSAVQSVQTIAIGPSGWTGHTKDATLSPTLLSATNALLVWNGSTSADSASGSLNCASFVTAKLASTTTVTASVGGSAATCTGGSAATWNGYVIEFVGQYVKSGGSDLINLPNASTPATTPVVITAVNTAKTALSFTGWGVDHTWAMGGAGGDNTGCQITPKLVLTDATHITASTCGSNVGNGVGAFNAQVGYSYVEFK